MSSRILIQQNGESSFIVDFKTVNPERSKQNCSVRHLFFVLLSFEENKA